MVELHGWLSIWETYGDEDLLSRDELDGITRKVKDVVSESGLELRYINGVPFVNTLLCSNHRTVQVDNIIGAYTKIAQTATGSYGVIYLRDDEDAEHYNEFQVYAFKNGMCTQRADVDFSLCAPTIEETFI